MINISGLIDVVFMDPQGPVRCLNHSFLVASTWFHSLVLNDGMFKVSLEIP